MAKYIYGIQQRQPQHHESWIYASKEGRVPTTLTLGIKGRKGNPPCFANFHRDEIIELRDTLNKWIKETHMAHFKGEL